MTPRRTLDPRAGLVARVAEALRARAAGHAHRDPAWAARARAVADRWERDAAGWYVGPARAVVAEARARGGRVSVDHGLEVVATEPGSRWLGEPGSVWGEGEGPGGAA